MKSFVLLAVTFASATIITGCGTAAPADVATASPTTECVQSTGSSICRRFGAPSSNNVESISGDALRKSGGPILDSPATKVGS